MMLEYWKLKDGIEGIYKKETANKWVDDEKFNRATFISNDTDRELGKNHHDMLSA